MDFETDQKLRLLTDALRAGPGSPQWRQAVAELRGDEGGGDEYQLLLRAREDLASGRSYREIRAGAGFTRKVMERIEREPAGGKAWLPSANWIAAVAGAAILTVLAIVAFMVRPAAPPPAAPNLAATWFLNTVESAGFVDRIDSGWKPFGTLPLEVDQGLRPLLKTFATGLRGGGVVWERPLAAERAFAVEAALVAPSAAQTLIVQVFITDRPEFEGKSATSARELVFLARGGGGGDASAEAGVVLPSGRVAGESLKLKNAAAAVNVRIAIDQRQGLIECNGQRLWSGEHGLDEKLLRTVGVRFVARGGEPQGSAAVKSVRIMEPEDKK